MLYLKHSAYPLDLRSLIVFTVLFTVLFTVFTVFTVLQYLLIH